jgi:glycosyltransferase involved in cell wall biosynthesis
MTGRLLFVAAEPPAVGGSSTAAFALFRKLRADGVDVHFVTVVDPRDAPHFAALLGGPPGTIRGDDRFSVCAIAGSLHDQQPELAAIIHRLDPATIVGFGYRAAGAAKAAAPSRRVVFVTGSCKEAQYHVTSGRVADAVALDRWLAGHSAPPHPVEVAEGRAVETCDLIVTHSPQTLAFMEHFYPMAVGRIFPRVVSFAEWIGEDAATGLVSARPFEARDIDVLFVASGWDRIEKNYPLVRAIAARLPGRSVHVIGAVARPDRRTVHEGFLASRADTFERMGRARVVACPSLIDAAPGVLFEAAVLGCNLVASRNCGNWELCHPDLLAPSLDPDAWVACITRGCEQPYASSYQAFLDAGGYAEFVAVLTALTQPFTAEAVS